MGLVNHRCAVMGQHPLCFPWGFDEEDTQCRSMKLELAQRIMELRQCGVTEYQVACDPGVGLYAAEIINTLRENDQALRLICALPHEGQATKWTPQLRDRYFAMLASCTDIICIAPHEQPDAQFSAYQRIVEQSDMVLAVYDLSASADRAEDRALRYALEELKKPALVLHPQTLTVQVFPQSSEKSHS